MHYHSFTQLQRAARTASAGRPALGRLQPWGPRGQGTHNSGSERKWDRWQCWQGKPATGHTVEEQAGWAAPWAAPLPRDTRSPSPPPGHS